MSADLTDKLQKVAANTVTTLAAPGKGVGDSSINVASTTNFPTDTGITIAIRQVDNNGELVAGTYTEFTATVASGTSFTIDPDPVLGTDQIYAAGSTTQVYMPVSSSSYNKMIDGLLVSHDQDGTLKAGAVDNAACLATGIVGNTNLLTTAGDIGGAWKDYTSSISGIAVTSKVTRYTQIGKTCTVAGWIVCSGGGSALYTIGLPFSAKNGTISYFGSCWGNDISTAYYSGTCKLAPGDNKIVMYSGGTSSAEWSTTVPFTWGANDTIGFTITYEIA